MVDLTIHMQPVGTLLFTLGLLLYVTSTAVQYSVDTSSSEDQANILKQAYNLSIAACVFMWIGAALIIGSKVRPSEIF